MTITSRKSLAGTEADQAYDEEEDEDDEEEDEDDEEEDEDDEEEDEDDEEDDIRRPNYRLVGYKMDYQVFEVLTERLPRSVNGYSIKYEYFDSELYVRISPSSPHARAVSAFDYAMMEWQRDPNDPTLAGNTLIRDGDAGKPPYLPELLTNLDRLSVR
jgi:hypothetical protein